MFKHLKKYQNYLLSGDIVLTVVTLALAVFLRPHLPGSYIEAENVLPNPVLFVMAAGLIVSLFLLTGIYEPGRLLEMKRLYIRMSGVYFLGVLMFAGLLYFSFRDTSRMLVVYYCSANYICMMIMRFLMIMFIRRTKNPSTMTNVLIVGVSEGTKHFAARMQEKQGAFYNVVGFTDDKGDKIRGFTAPCLGKLDDTVSRIVEHDVSTVIIAIPEGGYLHLAPLIFQLEQLPVSVYLVPDLINLALIDAKTEAFGDIMCIGIREPSIVGVRRLMKRIMDITVSGTFLFLGWPLLLTIAIVIKLDSKGPILYLADRVGENGKIFKMYKFRTMKVGADALQADVTTFNAEGQAIYKVKDDPRVTKLGKFLRKTSLDELPQFWNVFIGNMSLVGPRPEQPFITEEYDHWQWRRLSVPPGITGWWQIKGRSDLPMHLNTQYDIYYSKNHSFFLDIKIIFLTIKTILKGKGAY